MPVMDGYTATTEIRKFNQDIPIIALTASTINLDIESQARKSGLNGCITKPFNPKGLSQTLYAVTPCLPDKISLQNVMTFFAAISARESALLVSALRISPNRRS